MKEFEIKVVFGDRLPLKFILKYDEVPPMYYIKSVLEAHKYNINYIVEIEIVELLK